MAHTIFSDMKGPSISLGFKDN